MSDYVWCLGFSIPELDLNVDSHLYVPKVDVLGDYKMCDSCESEIKTYANLGEKIVLDVERRVSDIEEIIRGYNGR